MKIAVPYENGMIFQHFGRTEAFKLYEAQEGRILSSAVVETQGVGHGALAGMLRELGVEALICGGVGMGARQALEAAGSALYGGVTGDAAAAAHAPMFPWCASSISPLVPTSSKRRVVFP